VARLVPKQEHQVAAVVACIAELSLEAYQPTVGEVERDADDGDTVGATPLVASARKIVSGPEREAFGSQLVVKLLDTAVKKGVFELQADVATRELRSSYRSVSQLSPDIVLEAIETHSESAADSGTRTPDRVTQ